MFVLSLLAQYYHFQCYLVLQALFQTNWQNEERERISATMLPKFNKNRREKDKKVERERRGISSTLLPKFLCPNSCPSYAYVLKKSNCGNAIAKIGKKKKKKLVIVAMALSKMEKKKIKWNYGNVIAENGRKKKILLPKSGKKFKKNVLHSQYFYNTFTTNHK